MTHAFRYVQNFVFMIMFQEIPILNSIAQMSNRELHYHGDFQMNFISWSPLFFSSPYFLDRLTRCYSCRIFNKCNSVGWKNSWNWRCYQKDLKNVSCNLLSFCSLFLGSQKDQTVKILKWLFWTVNNLQSLMTCFYEWQGSQVMWQK